MAPPPPHISGNSAAILIPLGSILLCMVSHFQRTFAHIEMTKVPDEVVMLDETTVVPRRITSEGFESPSGRPTHERPVGKLDLQLVVARRYRRDSGRVENEWFIVHYYEVTLNPGIGLTPEVENELLDSVLEIPSFVDDPEHQHISGFCGSAEVIQAVIRHGNNQDIRLLPIFAYPQYYHSSRKPSDRLNCAEYTAEPTVGEPGDGRGLYTAWYSSTSKEILDGKLPVGGPFVCHRNNSDNIRGAFWTNLYTDYIEEGQLNNNRLFRLKYYYYITEDTTGGYAVYFIHRHAVRDRGETTQAKIEFDMQQSTPFLLQSLTHKVHRDHPQISGFIVNTMDLADALVRNGAIAGFRLTLEPFGNFFRIDYRGVP